PRRASIRRREGQPDAVPTALRPVAAPGVTGLLPSRAAIRLRSTGRRPASSEIDPILLCPLARPIFSGPRSTVMRVASMGLVLLPLLAGAIASAQTTQPPTAPAQPAPAVEDFKPASSNQGGKEYPQVNSERRARFRIVAPQAQSVRVPEWGGITLTKGEDGAWVGTTRPLDEGFHYYRINIDGADVPDPGSKSFYGAGRWGSAIEIPAQDEDSYAVKDVPHGQLRQSLYFSRSTNTTRRCFVYTPPGYDKDTGARYPV